MSSDEQYCFKRLNRVQQRCIGTFARRCFVDLGDVVNGEVLAFFFRTKIKGDKVQGAFDSSFILAV